jgi:hypothetical protein
MLRFERIPLKRALVLLLLTMAAPLTARTRAAPARSAVDQEYIAALATANRFLQAWRSQDRNGILLLSGKVKGQTAEEHLQSLFSRADNAQEAYEISGGRKLKAGRYIFSVALFNSRNGTWMQRRSSRIIVTRVGKNHWAVDKLPLSAPTFRYRNSRFKCCPESATRA